MTKDVNSKTLPIMSAPDGWPLQPPPKPKTRGLAKEAAAEIMRTYFSQMRQHFGIIARLKREKSVASGINEYIWISVPGICCDIGTKYNGKIFSYSAPPPEGHPSEGVCNSKDWCRCFAKNRVSGF